MPSNYAHHRFGDAVLPALTARQQRPLRQFRRLFDLGLHGPDLFFYYNPFFSTAIGGLGSKYHAMTGREFFTQACDSYRQHPSEGALAYLCGLLGHYALDSHVHPFVHAVTGEKIGHVELETEFDRQLLEADGKTPACRQNLQEYFHITRGECATAALYFPPATSGHIFRCKSVIRLALTILSGKNRKGLQTLLAPLGDHVSQQLMGEGPSESCAAHMAPMLALWQEAVEGCPELLTQLLDHLETGSELGAGFDRTFG